MVIEEFVGSWREATGELLAAWFIANPSGPTAFAVGFLERNEERILFYRHMHFTGGKSWLVSELSDEVAAHDGNFGGVLINTLIRLNNHFLVNGGDRIFLKEIPHIVITNGNLSVTSAFFEFIKLSTIDEDWGRHIYFDQKYGSNFFYRFEEEYRDIYESLKDQPDIDKNYLEFVKAEHGHRKGFLEWKPHQYTSSLQSEALFSTWCEIVYDQEYIQHGLYELSQMWVGACFRQRHSGLLAQLREEGTLETLDDMLLFFESMNFPLLPKELTEDYLKQRMRIEY